MVYKLCQPSNISNKNGIVSIQLKRGVISSISLDFNCGIIDGGLFFFAGNEYLH